MTSDEIKSLATEASSFLAAIPALAPYTAPIALGLAVAAAVAPPIYDEIKTMFGNAAAGAEIPAEQAEKLLLLIAALKSPDKYFEDGVASVTTPLPPSLNVIR